MPLNLDIKRKLSNRSDRVKCVDLHPTEPWMLTSLYNGKVHIWNIDQQQIVKSFEVARVPIRTAKFVARKFWVVCGSDDYMIRVFNYNTQERVHEFDAHSDYIRSIVVHPTQPFIITSSDDMHVKLWDWDQKWKCIQTYDGHTNYVMQIAINPKDTNTFATASLDHSIKIWSLGTPRPNFSLEGHEKGVNCVDYYNHGDKPYLVSGADDKTVKIWDYQTKSCVQTLEGHNHNVSFVTFHATLPIILSGSEDGTIRIWHASTYRLESTLNYGYERAWCVMSGKENQQNNVAIGYDEGSIVISLGSDQPAMSMDQSGKVICSRHCEIVHSNLRSALANVDEESIKDGERLPVSFKDLGICELYPQKIAHNANGRFVVVCGDGEYIVYTSMALRNKSFGQAQEFVWSPTDASMYATRENNTMVKVYKNFKEFKAFRLDYGVEQIFSGTLLGLRSSNLSFYDWESGQLIRSIEVQPTHVSWNENGQLVAICTKDEFFILSYNAQAVEEAIASKTIDNEPDGVEKAFDLLPNGQVSETVTNGLWFGDVFIFTNSNNRLRYFVGGQVVTVAHLDRPMHLLGYLAKENRVFLGDRDLKIVSYSLLLSILEYQTAILRGDCDTARSVLPSIPEAQRTKVAQFLEKQGHIKEALSVTADPDHKFELAMQMQDLDLAFQITLAESDEEQAQESKWKQLADAASKACRFDLAQQCLVRAKDYASLLLMASSTGDREMMNRLALETQSEGRDNLAFLAFFLLHDLESCLNLLIKDNRIPEATFFARTYMPSKVPELTAKWRSWLADTSKTPADSKFALGIANPLENAALFPGLEQCLGAEQFLHSQAESLKKMPASSYASQEATWERDVIAECEQNGFTYDPKKVFAASKEESSVHSLLQPMEAISLMSKGLESNSPSFQHYSDQKSEQSVPSKPASISSPRAFSPPLEKPLEPQPPIMETSTNEPGLFYDAKFDEDNFDYDDEPIEKELDLELKKMQEQQAQVNSGPTKNDFQSTDWGSDYDDE